MKSLMSLIIIAIICSYSLTGNSQNIGRIVNKSLNKATNKVENKAEKEVDKAIDEEIDKLFDKKKKEENTETETKDETVVESDDDQTTTPKSSSDAKKTQALFNMMGMGGTIKTDEKYEFTGNIKMEIESFDSDNNSKDKGYYDSYYNDGNRNYAMLFTSSDPDKQNSEGLMLYDLVNKAMIILSSDEGNKSGMVMPLNIDDSVYESTETENETAFNNDLIRQLYKKTGKTKTILGYKCEEYEYVDSLKKVNLWLCDEMNLGNSRSFSSMQGMGALMTGGYMYGSVLETETFNYQTNEKSTMKVVEINKNSSKTFNLQGYQLISMGGPTENKKE